jgi:hypothetical protein
MSDEPSSTQPISMSPGGPPRTVLPPEPAAVTEALEAAMRSDDPVAGVRAVLADHPTSLFGWATLGGLEDDLIIRYACYRVGYHRGLDALRGNGWRGSGDVPWSEPTNRGFLRSLLGLHAISRAIGDDDEGDRTAQFLRQLDRNGVPQDEIEAIAGPTS